MIKRRAPCTVVTKQMLVDFLDHFPCNIQTRIYSYIFMYNLKNQIKENRNVFCFLRAQCSETFNRSPAFFFLPLCLSEHEMFLNKMSARNCHFLQQ